MLQKDGFFRKRDENKREDNLFRPSQAETAAPVSTAANADITMPGASITPTDRKEAKLVVGPDIKLKGVEITDCDTLVVEGRVEASLDSRVIQIAEHGVFCGKVEIDVAEIHGRFDGELTARKHLIVHATAKVSGKIHYGKLKVEEGAELSGELASLSVTKGAAEVAAVKRPV